MENSNIKKAPDPSLISYKQLRFAVGAIGIALPFVLAIGTGLFRLILPDSAGFATSISGYYYTGMRNVFVGSLCAIGIFLGAYRGHDDDDRIAGNFACVFAIGVALFPTSPAESYTDFRQYIGWFHYFFAGALFLTLAYFCLSLFTRTHPKGEPPPPGPLSPQKVKENKVYRVSGWLILGSILLIGVLQVLFLNSWSPFQDPFPTWLYPVYWLEAVAVVFFGISWVVKSKAVFGDSK